MFALGTYLFINLVSKYPRKTQNMSRGRGGGKQGVGEFTEENLKDFGRIPKLHPEDLASIHYRLPWHRNTLGHQQGTDIAGSTGSEIDAPRYTCSRSWHTSATTTGSGLAGSTGLAGNSYLILHVLLIRDLTTEDWFIFRFFRDILHNRKGTSLLISSWPAQWSTLLSLLFGSPITYS